MVHISTSWWNIPQKRPAVIFNCPGATAYQKIYLLDLPNEILVDVFRLIKDPCALAQISLSCHRLHEVVEPLLWHSFQGDGHFEDFPRNPKDLKPFLLSILQRPELGSLVRVLKVANIQSSLAKVRSEDDLQKCDPNDRLLISNAVCQLSPPNPEKWFSAIYTGVSEVYFALLLSKLPKLETLYLGISWDSMPSMPLFDTFARIAVTERNSAEPVYLRGLTRLDVDWGVDQDDDSFELNEYKELLSLPSLKEFYGTQVCESDEGRHETRYPVSIPLDRNIRSEAGRDMTDS
jgi:hypothetical protein